jgi:hypothetical protein
MIKRLFLVLFLSVAFGCSPKVKHTIDPDAYNTLPQNERFIRNETINFTISVGYDDDIAKLNKAKQILRVSLRELKEQLNVNFVIVEEKVLPLVVEKGFENAPNCALQLEPNKITYDRHLNFCFLAGKFYDRSNSHEVLGVTFMPHGIILSQFHEHLDFLIINIVIHEIGHYLGAGHTDSGIMRPAATLDAYYGILPFDRKAVYQMRNLQNLIDKMKDEEIQALIGTKIVE